MFGVRGFTSNYRNGNTYAINSTQLSFKAIDFLFKRPIASEFFSNMKFNAFLDMGTAFYGAGVYDEANTLSKRTVVSPAGGVVIEVNEVKNPLIMSFGPGISTRIYGYNVSLDYAIGYEDQKLKSPQIHLGLGRTL